MYPHFNNNTDNAWKVAVEQTFELKRLIVSPQSPSRMTSAFAFMSASDANTQRPKLGGAYSVLYEVELVNPSAPHHIGIFELLTNAYVMDGNAFLPKVEALANSYWTGGASGTRELVTTSALRVIRAMS